MISTFKHKGLERFWATSNPKGIEAALAPRIRRLLDRLDSSASPEDMNIYGFGFHRLKGNRKKEFAVSVNGNWRITFRFDGVDAVDVNLEDYH
jgi:proteic killer suppression protein